VRRLRNRSGKADGFGEYHFLATAMTMAILRFAGANGDPGIAAIDRR
jgi:hypothetical protein